jgi:hypothetical protein
MNDYLMIKLKICVFDPYEFQNDRQDRGSCYSSFTLKPEKDFDIFHTAIVSLSSNRSPYRIMYSFYAYLLIIFVYSSHIFLNIKGKIYRLEKA